MTTEKRNTFHSRTNSKVLNIAHRGARAYAPENTLQSFKKAIEMGADGIELDVHLSRDAKMVVHHDDDLTRCTNIKESYFPNVKGDNFYLSNYSLEEIKTLDAGSWFIREYQASLKGNSAESYLNILDNMERDKFISKADFELYASGEVKIPTLEEVLIFVKQSACLVNIEIKTLPRMYEGITEQIMQLVEDMGLISSTMISSFDHQQILRARELNKSIYTAALVSDRLAKPNDYLKLLDADAYNPGCYGGYDSIGFNSVSGKIDPTAINLCRDNGYDINVWTCDEKDHIKQLIDLGVSGVITDIPNRVQEVLLDGR